MITNEERKAKQRETMRQWRAANPERARAQWRKDAKNRRERDREGYYKPIYERRKADPERNRAYQRAQYAKRTPEQRAHELEYHRKMCQRQRREAIAAYGGCCACCGETTFEFLAIDHIDGGGAKQRRSSGVGRHLVAWLIRKNYPLGFQILCHNCNMARGLYGSCPHSRNITIA